MRGMVQEACAPREGNEAHKFNGLYKGDVVVAVQERFIWTTPGPPSDTGCDERAHEHGRRPWAEVSGERSEPRHPWPSRALQGQRKAGFAALTPTCGH